MKKLLIIIVLFVYGITSVGATVHLHYCMSEYVGWELSHDEEDNKCGKCGMKDKNSGCCKEEHKQVKISADQSEQLHKILITNTDNFPAIIGNATIAESPFVEVISVEAKVLLQPSPPRQGPLFFIRYCSYLI